MQIWIVMGQYNVSIWSRRHGIGVIIRHSGDNYEYIIYINQTT